jgi:hypothetical protein
MHFHFPKWTLKLTHYVALHREHSLKGEGKQLQSGKVEKSFGEGIKQTKAGKRVEVFAFLLLALTST